MIKIRKEMVKKLLLSVSCLMLMSSLMSPNLVLAANSLDESELKNEVMISLAGSTSVEALAKKLAAEYTKKNTNVKIAVQGIGSSAGIKAVTDGICDIGTSSRELKEEEKKDLKQYEICLDGIAVVVNPNNNVNQLTKEQIIEIYTGKIRNWKDVGGIDKEITVICREDGSGTRTAFDELLKLEETKDSQKISLLSKECKYVNSQDEVKANIENNEDAIGYVSIGAIDNTIMALKIDGIEATTDNVRSKDYTLVRPFLFLTKGEPNEDIKSFIDFVLGDDGQKIIADNSYVSLK